MSLGAIIGAGIFVLSGTAIALAGSLVLLAFLLVGICVLFVALQLGELGSLFPNAKGASFSYVYEAFGSEMGFITGILLYMSYSTSISVIALGFGSYLASLLGMRVPHTAYLFAIGLIAGLAGLNLIGTKNAAKTDSVLVTLKIGVLLIFIAFAVIVAFFMGHFTPSNFALIPSKTGIPQLFEASVVIFFAYSGFQTISTFTSRVKGGANNAAKAIVMSVLISIVLYVLVVFALILLVPASHFSINGDPLAVALSAANAPKWISLLVGIGALLATASATLAMIISSSRVAYQISDNRLLPKIFRSYNKKRDVPINGVLVSAAIGMVMIFAGNIYIIAAIANFGLLFSYMMSTMALVHFRRIGKVGAFKAPFFPYLQIATLIALVTFFYGMPHESLYIGLAVILALMFIYYFFREAEQKKVIRIHLFK